MERDTNIKLKQSTKELLQSMGHKGETYNDIIHKTILKSYCLDSELDEMINNIDSASKRACFYLGVLFGKTYGDINGVDIKNYDKIKNLNNENFKFVYTQLADANANDISFKHDNLFRLISAEIINSHNISNISDDDMNLYYASMVMVCFLG